MPRFSLRPLFFDCMDFEWGEVGTTERPFAKSWSSCLRSFVRRSGFSIRRGESETLWSMTKQEERPKLIWKGFVHQFTLSSNGFALWRKLTRRVAWAELLGFASHTGCAAT